MDSRLSVRVFGLKCSKSGFCMSDFSKICSETGDSCLDSFNDNVVSRKFLILVVLPFLGQKSIACRDVIVIVM